MTASLSTAQGTEAEQALLGGLLLDNSRFHEVAAFVESADFAHGSHAVIFGALGRLIGGGEVADVVTVHLALGPDSEGAGGLAYLNSLAQSVPSAKNIAVYARAVADRALRRRLSGAALEIAAVADNAESGPLAVDMAREVLNRMRLPAAKSTARFRVMSPDDLLALPPLRWRIKGVLPAVGVAAVYGPSASGKSFLCFDMAAAIADGAEWFGHRVKPAPVVYLPLEGEAGFRLRAQAWEVENGRALPDGLRLVMDPFKLTVNADVQDLAAVVVATGHEPVVIVDTLNRAAPDCDENASADMGRVIDGAKALQRLTGGLVILVHHTGKDASRGLRGHSSLFAALDAAIEVTRDDDRRTWKGGKVKDGRDGDGRPFTLQVHELGTDDDGDTLTSCAVRPDTSAEEVRRVKLPQGGNQRLVLEALRPLFKAGTAHGKAGAPPLRACITLDAAIEAGAASLACDSDRRTERARQAITGLVGRGVLCLRDSWLWMT